MTEWGKALRRLPVKRSSRPSITKVGLCLQSIVWHELLWASDPMPDALTTITKLINSPPGQLAAGGVLAGIVWKFFERVESVLRSEERRVGKEGRSRWSPY